MEAHRGDPRGTRRQHLIAFVLFWAILARRQPQRRIALEQPRPLGLTRVPASTSVRAIEKGAPAEGMLRRGDRIVAVDGKPRERRLRRRGGQRPPLRRRAINGCRRRHARAARGPPRRARPRAVGLPPLQQDGKRMLIGFDFGETAEIVRRVRRRRRRRQRDVARRPPDAHGLRARAHQLQGPPAALEHRRDHPGSPTKRVLAGAGYALVFLGFISLILAVINLFPFLPLDGGHVLWSVAEKVRGRRISLARDVPLQLGRHRADAVPGGQRHRQRHRPPRGLDARQACRVGEPLSCPPASHTPSS